MKVTITNIFRSSLMHQLLEAKVLSQLTNKIYDHWIFLQQNPYARLVSITCFGYNYITAIETKFEVPGQTELATFLYQGTMHEQAKKNELIKETLVLEENEQIETVN